MIWLTICVTNIIVVFYWYISSIEGYSDYDYCMKNEDGIYYSDGAVVLCYWLMTALTWLLLWPENGEMLLLIDEKPDTVVVLLQ